ncbi:MAG: hypothetical protein Q9193_004913 [Seirophora villosa]
MKTWDRFLTYQERKLSEYGIYKHHRAKFRLYFQDFVLYPVWLVPWFCLFAWWSSVQLCKGYPSRQMIKSWDIEGICWQPSFNPYQQDRWWLRLWDQPNPYSEALPTSFESIMVSHLVCRASEGELRARIPECKRKPSADPLLERHLVSAANMLGELVSPTSIFSTTLCIEKDKMNHAFQTLVQRYATAMTSDRQEMSVHWIIALPPLYMLHFLNSFTESRFLPLPAPWSLQIEAEISYMFKNFAKECSDSIDAVLAAHRRMDEALNIQVLQAAIEHATAYQTTLENEILRFTAWQRWVQRPRNLEPVVESLALTKDILNSVENVKQFIETTKPYSEELINQLQVLNQNLKPAFTSRSGFTSSSPITRQSFNDQNSSADARNLAYLQALKIACENDPKSVPTEQHAICIIDSLRVILSRIDDDNLGMHQRSWCVERRDALDRYQPRDRTILLAQMLLQSVVDQYYEQNLSMPTSSSSQSALDA